MLFNSLEFLIFFPTIVLLYWIVPFRWRNALLLAASYYFYMNWEPVYALLLATATLSTWGGALLIDRSRNNPKKSKRWFIATLVLNLLLLFVFKYLNFAASEISHLLNILHIGIEIPNFSILLPVGISFFIFQSVGYLIDVKRNTISPERNLLTFSLFLAFFPQLVAGPIERASNLLPQFRTKHKFSFEYLMAGLEMMVLGYFMKVAVADNLAEYVDTIYKSLYQHNGGSVLLATFFFCFQIFADFAGYSMIAIGAARCMGFRLTQNFRQPYLATSVRDFWRRWHMSLSRWLTDYIYIPLGGNRVKPARHYFNIFITILLSGIWHGADYTFLAWGTYHGSLQCLQAAWHKKSKVHLPTNWLATALKIVWTFILVLLGRVFFRSEDISQAATAFKKIFTAPGIPFMVSKIYIAQLFMLVTIMMLIEMRHEYHDRQKANIADGDLSAVRSARSIWRSAAFIVAVTFLLIICGNFNNNAFIYFQF